METKQKMQNNAEKLRKKAKQDAIKRIKPAECQKYLRLVLDSSISRCSFGQGLLRELDNAQMQYVIRELALPQCIVWERNVGQRTFVTPASSEEAPPAGLLDEVWQLEDQVLQLITTRELLKTVQDLDIESIGRKLSAIYPDKQYTLVVICGRKTNEGNSIISNALIELQVLQQLASWQVPENNLTELVGLLRRFTKAVAEIPYKQQQAKILHSFKKYLANDKKQCVRVVGSDGFRRLWQQHLNRLPLVTLEVAEAVIAQYSCPKDLLAEYENNPDAIKAISELRIQRSGPQPLLTTADRRIGSVLSSKLYTLYNSRDPNELI